MPAPLSIETVATPHAPSAIGPYSQGVKAAGLVFVSGQIPLDPATGQLVEGDIGVQTDRAIANLAAILDAAGASLASVVKTTVYLANLDDFAAMNTAYAQHFGQTTPARATLQAARLPRDARVEIDAIALVTLQQS